MTTRELPGRLAQTLDKLTDVTEEGDNFRAMCPEHGGHSLLVKYYADTDRVVFTCFAGCDWSKLAPKLRQLGVELHGDNETYLYHDAQGVKQFEKRRWRKDGTRHQYYRCYGKNGVPRSHASKNKGTRAANGSCTACGRKTLPKLLYHLPEVAEAVRNWTTIYLCEGEKDADAVRELGAVATSTMNGADDWGPEYVQQLAGASLVIIVADNDPHRVGQRAAYTRYLQLTEHVDSVVVVVAAKGKDAYDHIANGHTLDDFVEVPIDELAQLASPGAPTESLSLGESAEAFDPLPGEEWTNLGYARRFIELHGKAVRYSNNEWLHWTGTHWERDATEYALKLSVLLSRRMTAVAGGLLDEKGRTPYRKVALGMEGAGNVLSTLRLARSELTVREDAFDTDSTQLVCESGILNDGKWSDHEPELLYTKHVPLAHNPYAECPNWEHFLRSSIPDEGQRKYLQTLIGFALVGGNRRKKRIVNLIGPKDTGKSTFLRILGEILGPYLATPQVDELVTDGNRRSGGDKFALHSLCGARLAAVSETERGSRFRVAPLKAVTGGDVISTQAKHRNPVTWRASVMLLIATNEQILFDIADRAFSDRLVPIEFKRSGGIDRDLNDKLSGELPGIFNWILSGVASYLRDEMKEPESIVRARETAEDAVSTPLQFVRWALDSGFLQEVGPEHPIVRCCRVKPLYLRYQAWCEDEGVRPMRFREFSRTIDQRYPKRDKCRDGAVHFSGIAPTK